MDWLTYIIDPDGEVMIVLQKTNAPFAELSEDMIIGGLTHTLPEPSDDAQKPAEEMKGRRHVLGLKCLADFKKPFACLIVLYCTVSWGPTFHCP